MTICFIDFDDNVKNFFPLVTLLPTPLISGSISTAALFNIIYYASTWLLNKFLLVNETSPMHIIFCFATIWMQFFSMSWIDELRECYYFHVIVLNPMEKINVSNDKMMMIMKLFDYNRDLYSKNYRLSGVAGNFTIYLFYFPIFFLIAHLSKRRRWQYENFIQNISVRNFFLTLYSFIIWSAEKWILDHIDVNF